MSSIHSKLRFDQELIAILLKIYLPPLGLEYAFLENPKTKTYYQTKNGDLTSHNNIYDLVFELKEENPIDRELQLAAEILKERNG
jgi:hypothetical protein